MMFNLSSKACSNDSEPFIACGASQTRNALRHPLNRKYAKLVFGR